MFATISSRTPEGFPHTCHVCGAHVTVEPSTVPRYDAPCPKCGTLLVFETPIGIVFSMMKYKIEVIIDIVERMPARNERQRIYVDFANVKSLDSSLLGKFLTLNRIVQAKRWALQLWNVSQEIQEVFGITKLGKL